MHKIYMGISYKGRSVVANTVVIFIIEFNIKKGYSLALKNNKLGKMTKKITLLSKVILCFITKLQRVFQDRATCHHAQLHQMPCRILPDIVIEHWHVLDLEREHQLILES